MGATVPVEIRGKRGWLLVIMGNGERDNGPVGGT